MAVAFECRGCGIRRPDPWDGPCKNPHCGRWYNFKRVNVHEDDVPGAKASAVVEGAVMSLCDVPTYDVQRISVGMPQVDRVLGGDEKNGYGLIKGFGQVIMLYSDPGLGKSTILISMCHAITKQRFTVLYVAGEEGVAQIKARADRIGKFNSRMLIVNEVDLDAILDLVDEHKPDVLVIDSGQTVRAEDFAPGSPSSLNALGTELKDLKNNDKIAVIVVMHVTKDGGFSGPKTFEHYVDTSLKLTGNPNKSDRVLRAPKNRFTPPGTVAYLRMTDKGLVEVDPPRDDDAHGAEFPAPPTTQAAAPKPPPADPITAWRGKDGMTAPVVLAVACEEPECHGAIDRACTAENGAREVGFHPSRIKKAKGTVKGKPAAKKPAPRKGKPKLEIVRDPGPASH